MLLGKMLRGATINQWGGSTNQVIVSTQSALLLNEFTADEIIVVERADGQSIFTRLETKNLKEWLTDYSIGELWEKNVLGGRPRSEKGHMIEVELNG